MTTTTIRSYSITGQLNRAGYPLTKAAVAVATNATSEAAFAASVVGVVPVTLTAQYTDFTFVTGEAGTFYLAAVSPSFESYSYSGIYNGGSGPTFLGVVVNDGSPDANLATSIDLAPVP